MKLNDETVLESLQFETADLSSGRSLVKQPTSEPNEQNASQSTGAVLEVRGFFSPTRAISPVEVTETNLDPTPTIAPVEASDSNLHSTTCTSLHWLGPETVRKRAVVWVPVLPLSREGFDVLQKFEGTVLSVTADSFIARLLDTTNPGTEEEAEFPLADAMPGDRELVKPGAVFYWVVGYERKAHGQICRSSVIRFQRLPAWSPEDIERAQKEAETFLSFLDLDRANRPA